VCRFCSAAARSAGKDTFCCAAGVPQRQCVWRGGKRQQPCEQSVRFGARCFTSGIKCVVKWLFVKQVQFHFIKSPAITKIYHHERAAKLMGNIFVDIKKDFTEIRPDDIGYVKPLDNKMLLNMSKF
jgi:hypothetical protein